MAESRVGTCVHSTVIGRSCKASEVALRFGPGRSKIGRCSHFPIQVAWYLEKVIRPTLDGEEAVCDLNTNLAWLLGSMRPQQASCIVSTSRPWSIQRRRCVSGSEALHLQGLPPWNQRITEFSESQLFDLAGNAFNGYVLIAVLAAMVAALGEHFEVAKNDAMEERDVREASGERLDMATASDVGSLLPDSDDDE